MNRKNYMELKAVRGTIEINCVCPHCSRPQISMSVRAIEQNTPEKCKFCRKDFRVNRPTD